MLKVKDIKTTTLQIRLTEQEKKITKEAAQKRGLSISDYLKQCVNKDLERENQ